MKKLIIPAVVVVILVLIVGGYQLYQKYVVYEPTYTPSRAAAQETQAPAGAAATPAATSKEAAATGGKYARWLGDWTLETGEAPGTLTIHAAIGANGLPTFEMKLPYIKNPFPQFPNLVAREDEQVVPFTGVQALDDSTVKCVIHGHESAPTSIEFTLNAPSDKLEMNTRVSMNTGKTEEKKTVFGRGAQTPEASAQALAERNFREAMIRNSVPRAKGDMRVLAVAIEAYFVDFNKYPSSRADYSLPVWLTTPIRYLMKALPDPFGRERGATYHYYTDKSAPEGWMLVSGGPDGKIDLTYKIYSGAVKKSGFFGAVGEFQQYLYDPTNGTMSKGDIIRWRQ
jgi:hypothetical protein